MAQQIDSSGARLPEKQDPPDWISYSLPDPAVLPNRRSVRAEEIADYLAAIADRPPRGTLWIADTIVSGDLSLAGLSLKAGIIFFRCKFEGYVDAFGLSARNLGFSGCIVHGGLDARDLKVDLHFTFRHESICCGPVLLRDAVIGGYVDCSGASFLFDPSSPPPPMPPLLTAQHEGQAFGCSRMRAQTLIWQGVTVGKGALSFKNATVSILRDDLAQHGNQSWRSGSSVNLQWFTYETKNQATYGQHIAWLGLDDDALVSGTRTLVTFLERFGDSEQAHRVLLWTRGRRADGLESKLDRRARRAYLRVVRLSFDLRQILRWLGLLFVVTWVACLAMWWVEWIGPDDLRTLANVCSQSLSPCVERGWTQSATLVQHYRLPFGYPHLEIARYSMNVLMPYLPGAGASGWAPTNALASMILGLARGAALVLQAALVWNVLGKRDLR